MNLDPFTPDRLPYVVGMVLGFVLCLIWKKAKKNSLELSRIREAIERAERDSRDSRRD